MLKAQKIPNKNQKGNCLSVHIYMFNVKYLFDIYINKEYIRKC